MLTKALILALLSVACHSIPISYYSGGLGIDQGQELSLNYGQGISYAKPIEIKHIAPITYAKPIAVAKQQIVDYHTPAHYEFSYGVKDPHTGDNKQQKESREGDTVKGEYSLAEPDGTIRVVKYTADPHNGFNAVVSRIGKASHPEVVHKVVSHGYGLGLQGQY